MDSRSKILDKLKRAGGNNAGLPPLVIPALTPDDLVAKITSVLNAIGGTTIIEAGSWMDVASMIKEVVAPTDRVVCLVPEVAAATDTVGNDPHALEDVKLAVMSGHFAVAENGAVWITDELMGDRALPFICERLALVVRRSAIVPSMYEAYERIKSHRYEFGTFIAGPSKTADIEQSLVLGAHGPKSLILFLVKD